MNKFLSLSLIFTLSASLHAMENNGKNPVYSYDEEISAPTIKSPREKKIKKYNDSFVENPADHAAPTATPSGAQESDLQSINDSELSLEEKRNRVFQLPFILSSGFEECAGDMKHIIAKMTGRIVKDDNERPESRIISPDGTYLATGYNEELRVTNIATGHTVFHDSGVTLFAFSPDSRLFATGSRRTARVTNIATKQSVLTVILDDWVTSVALSSNGSLLATGSSDGTVRVTNIETEQAVLIVNHNCPISSVALSPDSTLLATVSYDKTARVTNIATKQTVLRTVNHNYLVTSVALSPNSSFLAMGSFRTAQVINIATGHTVFTDIHDGCVISVEFSTDDTLLAKCHKTTRITDFVNTDRIARNATLDIYELLQAFKIAARDRARIHANEQQWKTWLQLKAQLPTHAQQRLDRLICNQKLQDENEFFDQYPATACSIL